MKIQPSLLPPKGILLAAGVMTRANTPEKHLDEKWKRMTPTEHVDAALRHLYAWLSGELRDPELDTSHLSNAAVRLLMASEREMDSQPVTFWYEMVENQEDIGKPLYEAPPPAPVQPEYEAWLDGKLPNSPATTNEQMAKWKLLEEEVKTQKEKLFADSPSASEAVKEFWKGDGWKEQRGVVKTIDDYPPSDWDAANASIMSEHQTRYAAAIKEQFRGDEE